MKKSRLLGAVFVCVIILGVAKAAGASLVTLDFEGFPVINGTSHAYAVFDRTIYNKGFALTTSTIGTRPNFPLYIWDGNWTSDPRFNTRLFDGSDYFIQYPADNGWGPGSSGVLTINHYDTTTFSLMRMDAERWQDGIFFGEAYHDRQNSFEVVGTKIDGSTVSRTINLGTYADTPWDRNFKNYTFGSDWNNLTSIAISNTGTVDYVAFDNIVINTSPVPTPASVWLFGSGLLGLVGMARRKKAA